MMKLTARQLGELFEVDRGVGLYSAIRPLYGLQLNLAPLSGSAIEKMLKPTKFSNPPYINTLSLQETERSVDFLKGVRVESKMTVSVGGHSGVLDGNKSFGRAFDVVYSLLDIKFPDGGVFEKVAVGQLNLWELTKISFKNSLRDLLKHTCYFNFKDSRQWYVDEENKKVRVVFDLFLAGGFYVGCYPTSSFKVDRDTALVLVE